MSQQITMMGDVVRINFYSFFFFSFFDMEKDTHYIRVRKSHFNQVQGLFRAALIFILDCRSGHRHLS